MIQAIPPSTAERLEADFYPSLQNPAVALCAGGWEKTYRATLQMTGNLHSARHLAATVYRMAMPPLTSRQNISDFIACVGFGMLLGAIKTVNATKFLYAAQVALAAAPSSNPTRRSKPKTRTHSVSATPSNKKD